MSKVEEVAKAILAKVPNGYGMTNDEALEYARAAIEAMREPTEAMCLAAKIWSPSLRESYQQMIDAALSEQEQG
jgi:hypothetical protein